jgi:hypothetical protein
VVVHFYRLPRTCGLVFALLGSATCQIQTTRTSNATNIATGTIFLVGYVWTSEATCSSGDDPHLQFVPLEGIEGIEGMSTDLPRARY